MPVALGIGLGVLALFFFAYGSALAAHNQATGWLGWLGEQVGAIPLFGPLTVKQLLRLNTWIASALKPAFDYADHKIAGFLATIGELHGWGSRNQYRSIQAQFNTAIWARSKFGSLDTRLAKNQSRVQYLIDHGKMVPLKTLRDWQTKQQQAALTRAIEADILKKLAHDPTWHATIAAEFPLAVPGVTVRSGLTKAQVDARIKAAIAAALAAIAFPMPHVIPGKSIAVPKPQAKTNTDVNKRVGRLEKILGVAGLAALIDVTFGREITRFLRCRNTRGIAKAWCGADLSGLLGILGAVAVIEGNFSIVTLAEEMLAIEEQMVGVVKGAFSELAEIAA